MRIAVTGSRSDVAVALARLCRARGLEVSLAPPRTELDLLGPVTAWESWLRSVAPDVVLHLAGSKPPASETTLFSTNVDGTERLTAAMSTAAPQARLIVTSSAAVYGQAEWGHQIEAGRTPHPTNAYGRSKAAQEEVALRWSADTGRAVLCARLFNITGAPSDGWSVAPSLANRIAATDSGATLPVKNGSAVRDFVDYRDAAGALLSLSLGAWTAPAINVCTGTPTTVLDVAACLARLQSKEIRFESVEDHDPATIAWSVGDPSAVFETGWRPAIQLETTLGDIIARM